MVEPLAVLHLGEPQEYPRCPLEPRPLLTDLVVQRREPLPKEIAADVDEGEPLHAAPLRPRRQ